MLTAIEWHAIWRVYLIDTTWIFETVGADGQILVGIPLESVPRGQTDLSSETLDHPMVGATWWIWLKAFHNFSIAPNPLPLTPIVGNPAFTPCFYNSKLQNFIENGQ